MDSPLDTKDVADVRYVDVLDQDGLRDRYASHAAVHGADIPEIDFALISPDGPRSLAAATAAGGSNAWVIASHVVEHVPDVIGWLSDIAEVLLNDGRLVLVVPDMRYTFDIHRHQTTSGRCSRLTTSKPRGRRSERSTTTSPRWLTTRRTTHGRG